MNARTNIRPMGVVYGMSFEEWRQVVGFEGSYSVSSLGRVRSEARLRPYRGSARRQPERVLRPGVRNGYPFVNLYRAGRPTMVDVHRLVLLAFVGKPPKPDMECAHGDGDTLNCAITNLRWATHRDNLADCVAHGTSNRGERHGMAKLTASQVLAIRADRRSHSACAAEFGISRGNVTHIKSGKAWSWLKG
jgi:hypothetical protein